jgi:hypothetical protein
MSDDKKIFQGDLTAKPGVIYEYERITGYLHASGADTKTSFPKLTTVGGSLDARGADTKTSFPKLTTVGGSLYANGADTKTSFPKLTTVGGSLDANGADTKTSFPKLTTVGGSLDARGADTSEIKANARAAPEICRRNIFEANLKIGYYFADGILARLINRKGRVARVIICGKKDRSYVVDDGNGNYSHGATLKEARDGLIYKLSSRDTSIFEKWTRKTTVSLADAIKAYQAITGACESGTRHFCEQSGQLPNKLTIEDAIKRTQGQYGSDSFAKFFAE